MRYILIVILVFTLTGVCFADNSTRIKELQDENQKLSVQLQQAQNFIQQTQVEIIKNSGAIEELTKQDKAKES